MKSFLKLASVMAIIGGAMLNAEGMNNQQNDTNASGTTTQTHLVIINQDFFNQNFRPNTPMEFRLSLDFENPAPCLLQMLVLMYQGLLTANPYRTAEVGGPLTEEQMRSKAVDMTNQQAVQLGVTNYRVQLQQVNAVAEAVNDAIEDSDPRNNNSSH